MKYKLTKNSIEVCGKKLFQIQATVSFGNIEKGELGGYIEKEENLSQENNAWVYGDARVSGNARVYGDAWVYGNAWVSGDARVFGDARVYGNARVYGDAWVFGDARVSGNARVYGDARVYGNAWVSGDAQVYGEIKILAGYFFGTRYNKEEIKFKENEDVELIYKGEAKFEDVDDEVEKAIKLLESKGKLKDGKILI